MNTNWYEILNISEIETPAIVIYKDGVKYNIAQLLKMVNGDRNRLMPHIKTNKCSAVIHLIKDAGIKKVKASTLAEAELAAQAGMDQILIAHQLVGSKIEGLTTLTQKYTDTRFQIIIDNLPSAQRHQEAAKNTGIILDTYIDINNGMNRTGISYGDELKELVKSIQAAINLNFKGLHIYDGHHRDLDFELRRHKIETDIEEIEHYFNQLKSKNENLELICGGTPAFSTHAL